jgi:hypothetical protein
MGKLLVAGVENKNDLSRRYFFILRGSAFETIVVKMA